MRLRVELDRDDGGRWTAKVAHLPGVRAEGADRWDVLRAVQVLALRAIADRLERGEPVDEANPFDLEVADGPGIEAVRGRFADAVESTRRNAEAAGLDRMTTDEIDAEIRGAREARRRRAASE